MDTSEQYIKMCEKATKIQEYFKEMKEFGFDGEDYPADTGYCTQHNQLLSKDGNRFIHCICFENFHNSLSSEEDWSGRLHEPELTKLREQNCEKNGKWIWLPRQDQLQEMLDSEYTTYDLFDMFDHDFLESSYGGAMVRCPDMIEMSWSMEMFWLALVMKENYSKIWNGKDWVVA